MGNDQDPRPANASSTGQPANWDRDEMKADFGDDAETPGTDDDAKVPTWNEDEMARQRPDGTRSPGPSNEEIASSKGGLSGGGANPGGGERWAERDKEQSDT